MGPYATPPDNFLAFLPLTSYTNNSLRIHVQAKGQNATSYFLPNTPPEIRRGYKAQHQLITSELLSNKSAHLEIILNDGGAKLGLEQPYSRGSVRAISSNTFDYPLADSRFLQNPLDVTLFIEGVSFVRKLTSTPAFQSLQPLEMQPGVNVTGSKVLEEYIRSNSRTFYHPSGTCKMGPRGLGGVVDDQLRVYGVQGLRVVTQVLSRNFLRLILWQLFLRL